MTEFDLGMLNCFAEIENNQVKYFDMFSWNMLEQGVSIIILTLHCNLQEKKNKCKNSRWRDGNF